MNRSTTILQIVPKTPGQRDGVGDYALTLARKLRERFSTDTIFAAAETVVPTRPNGFETLPLSVSLAQKRFEHVILHYVNYGYQKRGVPFALPRLLRQLRERPTGRFFTVFHELYASGPMWSSAFWLRPFQINIGRSISNMSDLCIVSSESIHARLKKIAPRPDVLVHPVPSNFGEPVLSTGQFNSRSAHRWVICGGTALIERSLRSFQAIANRVPQEFFPQELFVLGGKEDLAIRADLPNVQVEYRPEIAASDASQILASCSFAWLDYFHHTNVATDVVLKSSAFAAACAHGVIPIFPMRGSVISVEGDRFPGPYFIDANSFKLPASEDRTRIAIETYDWYGRRSSSDSLAESIVRALTIG